MIIIFHPSNRGHEPPVTIFADDSPRIMMATGNILPPRAEEMRFSIIRKAKLHVHKMIYFLIIALALMPVAVRAGERNAPSFSRTVQARLLTDREYFDVLRESINKADSEIVVCAYLFKTLEGAGGYPERIVQSLSAAVKRGVRVSAVMELSQESGDLLKTNAKTARRLEQAGIKVCPDPKNVVTHTKLVIIDRRFLFVGSHNLTQSAFRYNHEVSVWIDSPVMAAEALDYLNSLCEVKKGKIPIKRKDGAWEKDFW